MARGRRSGASSYRAFQQMQRGGARAMKAQAKRQGGPTLVKAHRRGKSLIKSYRRLSRTRSYTMDSLMRASAVRVFTDNTRRIQRRYNSQDKAYQKMKKILLVKIEKGKSLSARRAGRTNLFYKFMD